MPVSRCRCRLPGEHPAPARLSTLGYTMGPCLLSIDPLVRSAIDPATLLGLRNHLITCLCGGRLPGRLALQSRTGWLHGDPDCCLIFRICNSHYRRVGGRSGGRNPHACEAALREADAQHQLKLVAHELQIARSIQQSLLPKVRPQITGYEVTGWSRSADDTGGDFYDWKKLADGRWIVVLADVTGHGIGPAMLASVCRAYSRASFNVRDRLETILKNINQAFAEDLTSERFA